MDAADDVPVERLRDVLGALTREEASSLTSVVVYGDAFEAMDAPSRARRRRRLSVGDPSRLPRVSRAPPRRLRARHVRRGRHARVGTGRARRGGPTRDALRFDLRRRRVDGFRRARVFPRRDGRRRRRHRRRIRRDVRRGGRRPGDVSVSERRRNRLRRGRRGGRVVSNERSGRVRGATSRNFREGSGRTSRRRRTATRRRWDENSRTPSSRATRGARRRRPRRRSWARARSARRFREACGSWRAAAAATRALGDAIAIGGVARCARRGGRTVAWTWTVRTRSSPFRFRRERGGSAAVRAIGGSPRVARRFGRLRSLTGGPGRRGKFADATRRAASRRGVSRRVRRDARRAHEDASSRRGRGGFRAPARSEHGGGGGAGDGVGFSREERERLLGGDVRPASQGGGVGGGGVGGGADARTMTRA